MPLIILGLLFLICLLVYSVVKYMNSEDTDGLPVRERFPDAFGRGRSDGETGGKAGSNRNSGNTSAGSTSGADNGAYEDEDGVIHPESYVDEDSFRGDIDYMARNLKESVRESARKYGIDKFGQEVRDKLNSKFRNVDDEDYDIDDDEGGSEDSDRIIFPTDNIEVEKKKRNIH